jgi:SAM-dependent methyltransferase
MTAERERERELWRLICAQKEASSWDDWQAWNRLYVQRTQPGLKRVLAAYDQEYDAERVMAQAHAERADLLRTRRTLYTYGETSWLTFAEVLKTLAVTSQDRFIDLGCGHGQLLFWVHLLHRIPVQGVEITPAFVTAGQRIAQHLQLPQVTFVAGDLLTIDLSTWTVAYMTCTCFDDDYMAQLASHVEAMPTGARIATVTRPLVSPHFQRVCRLPGRFNWGADEVWVYRRL